MRDVFKRYPLLIVAFMCCLFIPFFYYTSRDNSTIPFEKQESFQKPFEYPTVVKYNYKWPESNTLKASNLSPTLQNEAIRQIDQKYCGQDRCKFMLPVSIVEQESKAQMHVRQLAFLSGKIGRTLVLPNVQNSHLGACLAHPFDFYYDHSWFDNHKNKFNYITMQDFKAWTLERHYAGVVPTGQELFIQGADKSKFLKSNSNCFRDSFDFKGRPRVSYQLPDHPSTPNRMNLTSIMMDILSDEARAHEYGKQPTDNHDTVQVDDTPPLDVINLFYDRRYAFVRDSGAGHSIAYSKKWVDIADKIAAELQPFVAIHWRMERLEPVSNLVPCAEGLIDEIHKLDPTLDLQLEQTQTIKHPNVFLLTDYPHLLNTTGAVPESNSFKANQVKAQHHEAIRYLYSHLNITLTTMDDAKTRYDQLPKENWHLIPIDTKGNTNPIDRSVLGIVDKLVAMKAQWFFAGRRGICAKASSFTSRISKSRNQAFRKGTEEIIVPLITFDKKQQTKKNNTPSL